jgi:hypothetical protein
MRPTPVPAVADSDAIKNSGVLIDKFYSFSKQVFC